jgi:hypothetical protein
MALNSRRINTIGTASSVPAPSGRSGRMLIGRALLSFWVRGPSLRLYWIETTPSRRARAGRAVLPVPLPISCERRRGPRGGVC